MKSHQMSEENSNDFEAATHESDVSLKTQKIKKSHQKTSLDILYEQEPTNKRIKIKLCVFLVCLTFLFIGRYSVPSNDIPHIKDIPMNWFDSFNAFIEENHAWRNAFQIICSLFMDIMFIGTGAYWILRGNSSRLVVATLAFYIVRAIVQGLFWLPFPHKGYYWWDDPGFPSFVVPYGKGSDFFFSGHIGFVTICATEWKRAGRKVLFWILTIGGIYTAIILLAYHVHYSIDLFTGAFFAHWMYTQVDDNKEAIDSFVISLYYNGKSLLQKGVLAIRRTGDGQPLF